MQSRLLLTVIAVFGSSFFSFSQSDYTGVERVTKPVWSATTGLYAAENKETWDGTQETSIQWLKVTASGRLLIGANKGLIAYDPDNGKAIFDSRIKGEGLPNVEARTYEDIPNSPLFRIQHFPFLGRANHYIVNSINGNIYGSNDLLGINNILETYVLPLSGSILYVGRKDLGLKSGLASKNLKTGKMWTQDDIFTWKMLEHRIAGQPFEVSAKEVILPMDNSLYCLNSETGELKWRTYITVFASDDFGATSSTGFSSTSSSSASKSLGSSKSGMTTTANTDNDRIEVTTLLFKHSEKPLIYLINPTGLMAYDITTGEEVWKKYRKADIHSKPILTPEGILVCTDRIYLYDYATGDIIYNKPAKFGGEVHFYDFVDEGIVIGIHKLDRKQQSYYELNILDVKTGTLKFEEPFETNGLLTEMWLCAKGVFYTTDRALGIWDKSTGKDAFEPIAATSKKRNIFNYESQQPGYVEPANGSLLTVFDKKVAYVYNAELNFLYQVNTETGVKKQLNATPLSIVHPEAMELRSNGVLLTSAQRMTLVDYTGNVVYNNEFKAPGYTLLAKVVAIAAIVYDSYRDQNDAYRLHALESGAGGSAQTAAAYSKSYTQMAGERRLQIDVEGAEGVLHDRFEQSLKSSDFQFINTQLASKRKDGENEFGLVMVDKNTGEVAKVFPFGFNRAPQFTVDEITQKLFYLEGDMLHCYQL